jgi:hypothetical protein
MAIAWFISSTGDTDLALATADEIQRQFPAEKIFLIAISAPAITQTAALPQPLTRLLLRDIINSKVSKTPTLINTTQIEKIIAFIKANSIRHVFLGVASFNNEIPFQIAQQLQIPHTIVYEYMFKPQLHKMWDYVGELATNSLCSFAVTLPKSAEDIKKYNANATIKLIGHLSIDRALTKTDIDHQLKEKLEINPQEDFIFLSGSSMPDAADHKFMQAFLDAYTGENAEQPLRFGLHPGTQNVTHYLESLLALCARYPGVTSHIKFVLPPDIHKKVTSKLQSKLLLPSSLPNQTVSQLASKIAQVVPGALLNEAIIQGKPGFIYDTSTQVYLPEAWFKQNVSAFLRGVRQTPHSREELGLENLTAPQALAHVLTHLS